MLFSGLESYRNGARWEARRQEWAIHARADLADRVDEARAFELLSLKTLLTLYSVTFWKSNKELDWAKAAASLPQFAPEAVRQHASKEDCWIVLDGYVRTASRQPRCGAVLVGESTLDGGVQLFASCFLHCDLLICSGGGPISACVQGCRRVSLAPKHHTALRI